MADSAVILVDYDNVKLIRDERTAGDVANNLADVVPASVVEAKRAGRKSFGLPSKALSIALVEAIVMIMIYVGLVREYSSNVNMQNWVRTNFALGGYFLNYYGLLILAGLLGVAIFRLIPRRLQSKNLQR